VARRGDDLERPDAVAGDERPRGARRDLRHEQRVHRAGLLAGVERAVAGEEARVAGGQQDLGVGDPRVERVERAVVVVVGVGDHDAPDRAAVDPGGLDELVRRARRGRVDEGHAVLLAHEVRVGQPEAVEADQVVAVGGRLHGRPVPVRRRAAAAGR
jgi:hypothetical protein